MRLAFTSILGLAFLGLTACAAPQGQPVPETARLSAQVLTLVLSDGTVCQANWADAPTGRLEPCGPGYGYSVRVIENPNVLRQIWTGLATALGAEGMVPPLAEVVITDPAGVDKVFASPPPVSE